MYKLVILFRQPQDVLEFETRWSNEFVPVAERMPGIQRVSVSRVIGGPSGEVDLHLVHEFYFSDLKSLQAAMASPAGQEAGRALMAFAPDETMLCFSEHLEEDRTGG